MNSKQFLTQCYKLGQAVAKRQHTQQLSTSVVSRGVQGNVHPKYEKIRAKYRHFQTNDGTPVHLKGGPADYVLYYATLVASGAGLLGCFHLYYTMAFPKKPAA